MGHKGRAVVVAAGGVAVAVAAVRRARRRVAPGAAAPHPPALDRTDRVARTAEVARLAGRTGASYGVHRARRVFASAERREALDTEFQLRTTEDVVASLGNLKGAMMKLGQMASYLDPGMPPHMREMLAQLQADAPPMSGELATATLEAELGAPVSELFDEWDPVPIASASIGQVHRAITVDGRAVAVKVQYPGVAEAMAADLGNADLLFNALRMLFPGLDVGPLVEELRARLLEELDYTNEAANQQVFADYYADHPFIRIPAVIPELSGPRILTTELAVGEPFSAVRNWDEAARGRAAEIVFRYVIRSLYCLHAFNGDPHPGNYLFSADGTVTFLDYGLVKRFTADELQLFVAMHKAMVIEQDPGAYRRLVEDAGLLTKGAKVTDAQVGEYFGGFYAHLLKNEAFGITPDFAADIVARFFDATGPYVEMQRLANVPPTFVIVQRINLGLYALLADLGATANWRAITHDIVPFVDAPPASELGEQEAAWLAEREAASRAEVPAGEAVGADQ